MILRLLFKAVLIVLLIIGVSGYLIYLKTGTFWTPSLGVPDLSLPGTPGEPSMKPLNAKLESTYKWRKNGRWHYGDSPPPGVDAISLEKQDQSPTSNEPEQ